MRMEHPGGGAIYKPLPPDRLYLDRRGVGRALGRHAARAR